MTTTRVDQVHTCTQLGREAWMVTVAIVLGSLLVPLIDPAYGANGQLELRVVDEQTGEPVAVRMHLWNQRGRPVIPKGTLGWKDHFVFPGTVVLDLPTGDYRFEMERGPEYAIRSGHFRIERSAQDSKQVDMVRFVDMKQEGWWSGDLHIHRSPEDMRLLMLAEDLHIAPVITWWNDHNHWSSRDLPEETVYSFAGDRFYDVMAGEDERGGGALLYFQRDKPLDLSGSGREFPSSLYFLLQAKRAGPVHVDIEKPFWWDMPMWVATRRVDSIGIAHNHMWRDGVLDNEAWGRPRDTLRYPAPHGNGQWSQDIYYHLLNCGFRIPPSAGSASGVLPNPVGYNRVYVHVEGELTYDKWWEGLRAGRVMVTNGPLLRPFVQGHPPGHVFTAPAGEAVELSIQLNLSLREDIEYLEVVQNGRTVHEVRLAEYAEARGKLPLVRFEESGWMLVRAVTSHPKTYRFASSGPFYVEIGEQPRISRQAVRFFVEWMRQREAALEHTVPEELEQLRRLHAGARRFWENRLDVANTD